MTVILEKKVLSIDRTLLKNHLVELFDEKIMDLVLTYYHEVNSNLPEGYDLNKLRAGFQKEINDAWDRFKERLFMATLFNASKTPSPHKRDSP